MKSLLKKIVSMKLSYAQMLFVVITFALMVIVSYSYGNSRERFHLMRRAEDALTNAQTHIMMSLQESKSTFVGMSESTHFIITNGGASEKIQDYFNAITAFMLSQADIKHGAADVYGYFDCFGGIYINGAGKIIPDDYDPSNFIWYDDAVKAGGSIVVTEPYFLEDAEIYAISYARSIYDNSGVRLGIIWIEVLFDYINEYVANTRLTDDGYSLMMDTHLDVIAHPSPGYFGRNISLLNDGDIIAADMRSGAIFGTYDARSYLNERSELVWKVFDNGWVLCLMTPYDTYYQSIQDLAWYLGILGIVFAIGLSVVLMSVTAAKIKSDEENKQKSNFLATVSHEIRTPLNAIIGVTEMELMDKSLPTKVRDAFTRVYNSGYSLLTIINDLLDLSKIEAGKIEINPARYETASLINDIIHYTLFREDSKPLEFELIVEDNLPATLIGDELRIRQVLNNIISNAYKYTDEGKITLKIASETDENGAHCIAYTVSDTGYGMTPDQMSKLYDAYARFMTVNAYGSVSGTGLGMNITKRLIDLMTGSITINSVVGEGSVFVIKIPQAVEGNEILSRETAEKLMRFSANVISSNASDDFSREYMPYGSVLVVDDMESNLYVAKGLLAPYGLKIAAAANGQEAIDVIKEGAVFDLILMDHMMPVMDGMEATRRIRELGYDKPIVTLTANAMQGQAELFLSKGFDDFLSKPVDIRQLDMTLNRFIREKQSLEVIEEAREQKKNNALNKIIEIVDSSIFGNDNTDDTLDEDLVRIFVRDCGKVITTLEEISERLKNPSEEDLKTLAAAVHSIKGALSHMGASDLTAASTMLEQAARNNKLEIIADATDKFITDLKAVVEKLKPGQDDAYLALSEEEKKKLCDLWFDVYTACISKDADEIAEKLELLKEQTILHADADTAKEIEDLIAQGDFDAARDSAERNSNR
ncbi:MAG: response regulator [Oscillospiraceae bacterium]|nr:response regulator [Oscillospiraceae bacterium]